MAGLLGDVLPYAYSRGNALQRRLRGLLEDPKGTANQLAGLLQDQHGEQERLNALAFADPKNPFTPTDQNALAQLIDRTMAGPMGFAPAGVMVYRAGAPKGMTADAGGPTFYATEKRGAEPFTNRGQIPIQEYDINPQTVLDTQLARYRALYEQFTKETGNPAGYGMSGRPYWTAEHNFKKWLDSKGHKFDAVMFDEPTGVPSYAVYRK